MIPGKMQGIKHQVVNSIPQAPGNQILHVVLDDVVADDDMAADNSFSSGKTCQMFFPETMLSVMPVSLVISGDLHARVHQSGIALADSAPDDFYRADFNDSVGRP